MVPGFVDRYLRIELHERDFAEEEDKDQETGGDAEDGDNNESQERRGEDQDDDSDGHATDDDRGRWLSQAADRVRNSRALNISDGVSGAGIYGGESNAFELFPRSIHATCVREVACTA